MRKRKVKVSFTNVPEVELEAFIRQAGSQLCQNIRPSKIEVQTDENRGSYCAHLYVDGKVKITGDGGPTSRAALKSLAWEMRTLLQRSIGEARSLLDVHRVR